MEPPIIRQKDSGNSTQIFTVLGLAFFVWIVSIGLTCLWWRGYRRRRSSSDTVADVSDMEQPNTPHGTPNGPHSRRQSSVQGPVPPPQIYNADIHTAQNSAALHTPHQQVKNLLVPSGEDLAPTPIYASITHTSANGNDHVVQLEPDKLQAFKSGSKQKRSTCSICLRGLKARDERGFECGHVMHGSCLKRWCATFGQTDCPVCQTVFGSRHAINSRTLKQKLALVQ